MLSIVDPWVLGEVIIVMLEVGDPDWPLDLECQSLN